jgi:hypothetical protein
MPGQKENKYYLPNYGYQRNRKNPSSAFTSLFYSPANKIEAGTKRKTKWGGTLLAGEGLSCLDGE